MISIFNTNTFYNQNVFKAFKDAKLPIKNNGRIKTNELRDMLLYHYNNKNTALHSAVKNNHIKTIKYLIKQNPNCVHIKDIKGNIPLFYAKSELAIKILLTNGSNPNSINYDNDSASSCATGKKNMIIMMIKHGADINLSKTILRHEISRLNPDFDFIQLLIKDVKSLNPNVIAYIRYIHRLDFNGNKIYQLLIKKGLDVNIIEENALMFMLCMVDFDSFKLTINQINKNLKEKIMFTLCSSNLRFYRRHETEKLMYLLQTGINPDITTPISSIN